MKHYFRKYPLSILLLALVVYLSFFTPPKTGLDEITDFDKLVHICMYGGLCSIVWIEYWRSHRVWGKWHAIVGGILLPLIFSGAIELLQEYCTTDRSGDWEDMIANSIGVLLAASLGVTVFKKFKRKE